MNITVLFSHIYALYFVITFPTTSLAYRAMQTENNDHISFSINIRLPFSHIYALYFIFTLPTSSLAYRDNVNTI